MSSALTEIAKILSQRNSPGGFIKHNSDDNANVCIKNDIQQKH